MVVAVEMLNGDNLFFLLFQMEQDQFIDDIKVFTGPLSNAPMANDGNLLLERFPYQYALPNAATEFTLTIRASEMQTCSNIIVWARVSTRDMFGTILESHETWMMGNHFSNGYTMPYCLVTCLLGNQSNTATL